MVEAWRLPSAVELRAQLASRSPPASRQSWKPLSSISPQLKESVVAWEDPGFYHHSGVSAGAMLEAFSANLKAGGYARGGSTIPQQVVKNLFLTREKTLRRKFQDVVLARRLEQVLSKEEILEVYLNTAEWGENIHGAEAAAGFYFGVSSAELDWKQAALLTGILPNPHTLNPCVHPAEATMRRNLVLAVLQKEGQITKEEYKAATAAPLGMVCGRSP
ncbi:MAG: transglycosylase domain-containing protein [Terriglobales bacterium]